MSQKIKNLEVKISKHAKEVYSLLLEGVESKNALIYNGQEWILQLDTFTTKDADLDVSALTKGDPGVTVKLEVSGAGLAPETSSKNDTYNGHGYSNNHLEAQCKKQD